eukprot:TRINITY_DN66126_c0_g1_i1.p1 TRINITY_DN66126_c0_g1~~TRINITY_DN66126_c0_g1_i1.p1  ORF type:complete len:189 (-),score=7.79 TRINITY_DN66126_c0_g1_i1:141-650(-)
MAAFFLNFIPELGPIISMILPVPFILLTPTEDCPTRPWEDCIVDFDYRLKALAVTISGMLLIKFLVSNLLSSVLMGKNPALAGAIKRGDTIEEVKETHGVVVLFAVVFFGKIWGPVGMLISVPVISVVRLTVNFGLDYERRRQSMAQGGQERAPVQTDDTGRIGRARGM